MWNRDGSTTARTSQTSAMTAHPQASHGRGLPISRSSRLRRCISVMALTLPDAGVIAEDPGRRSVGSFRIWWLPFREAGRSGQPAGSARRQGPHSLRHGFGTELVEAEADIRVLLELMMHESLATPQIYTVASERPKRNGIAALLPRAVPVSSGRRAA